MKTLAISGAVAVMLLALPAAAQAPQPQSRTPDVPATPHQSQTLRSHPSGEQTPQAATRPPTAGGGAAPVTPHQQDATRDTRPGDQAKQQQQPQPQR